MAFWNKHEAVQPLQEAARGEQLNITDLLNLPYYQFASQLTTLRGQQAGGINGTIKQAMLKDPIISRIINMWISDALTHDVITGDVFTVEVTKNKDTIKDEDIAKVNDSINYLLENSNLENILDQLLYKIITEGISSIKLGYVDPYEDTRIKLFESNKNKVLKESSTWSSEDKKKLLEAPNFDDYEDEMYKKRSVNARKMKRLLGRFYFEILPSKLVPLKHKGITVLYLDLNNATKVLNPRNITTFVNTRGGVKTLALKDNPEDIVSTIYEIPLGQSFIENAVTPWSMMNTVEDCTMLALMTRSAIYRLFQIDVGAMSTKETETFLQEFKKRLTTRETIDLRSQHYSSAQTQVPLGDSILIPTRNGVGTTTVQAVGGDLKIDTEVPMEYFREQLLASLGVPAALVYGDESGALINTSATRQDIRYLRTIQQFTAILSLGLEDVFKDYLSMLGFDLSKIAVKVKFSQINSEEALQRMEFEQTKQEALDRAITSLENLGISFKDGGYRKTRDLLVQRFMDQELLDMILEDEKDMPVQPIKDEGPKDDDSKLEPLPAGSATTSEVDVNLNTDEPTEDEFNEDLSVDTNEPEPLPEVEPTGNVDVNADPPYSIG